MENEDELSSQLRGLAEYRQEAPAALRSRVLSVTAETSIETHPGADQTEHDQSGWWSWLTQSSWRTASAFMLPLMVGYVVGLNTPAPIDEGELEGELQAAWLLGDTNLVFADSLADYEQDIPVQPK